MRLCGAVLASHCSALWLLGAKPQVLAPTQGVVDARLAQVQLPGVHSLGVCRSWNRWAMGDHRHHPGVREPVACLTRNAAVWLPPPGFHRPPRWGRPDPQTGLSESTTADHAGLSGHPHGAAAMRRCMRREWPRIRNFPTRSGGPLRLQHGVGGQVLWAFPVLRCAQVAWRGAVGPRHDRALR